MKNKFKNLRLKVFQSSKDCLAVLNKLSPYQKAKLCLFALVSFGFLEKIESLVGLVLEKVESLSTSTQNNEIEIKFLREQLSLRDQYYENEQELVSLKKEVEIDSLMKRYGLTAVGFGLVYTIGLYSAYSDEIRQMFQIVYDNRVALVALVNLLRPFINLNQSNTQNRPNTGTPRPDTDTPRPDTDTPQLTLRNGEDAPDLPGVD